MANSLYKVHELMVKAGVELEEVDKKHIESIAEKAGDLLSKGMVKAASASFDEIGDILNKKLRDAGKEPIVFSNIKIDNNTLDNMVSMFADRISSGIATSIRDGIKEGFKVAKGSVPPIDFGMDDQLKQLKADRQKLLDEYEKTKKLLKNKTKINDINNVLGENKELTLTGDLKQHTDNFVKQFEEAVGKMKTATKGTKEYEAAVLDAQSALDRLGAIQSEWHKKRQEFLDTDAKYHKVLSAPITKANIEKEVELKAKLDQLKSLDINHQISKLSKLKMSDDAHDVIVAFSSISDTFDEVSNKLHSIESQIQELDRQIGELENNTNILKSLEEIEKAYDRILKKRGKASKEALEESVGYEDGMSLTKLANRYNKSKLAGEDWENQYIWLVKFVEEYDKLSQQGKDINAKHRALYSELHPMYSDASKSLSTLFNKGVNAQQGSAIPDYSVEVKKAAEEEIEAKNEVTKAAEEEAKVRMAIVKELAKHGTFEEAHKAGGKKIEYDGQEVSFGKFVGDYFKNYLGQSFSKEGYEKLWKEARAEFGPKFEPFELTKEDAIEVIREKVPDNILDGWFRGGDSSYKEKLEQLAMSDDDIRNAALNIMWSNFKEFSGKDIGFAEFLQSEISMYRGKNSENYVSGDETLAFTFDKKVAEGFGKYVLETLVKPIETLGAYQTTGESESLVYRNKLENRPEYQQWHAEMKGVANETSVKANKEAADAAEKESVAKEEILKTEEKRQKLLLYRHVEGEFDPKLVGGKSDDDLRDIKNTLAYGMGGFGDGTFASTMAGARALAEAGTDDMSFFEFDASDYKFYVNETIEDAEKLRTFLMNLQRIVGDGSPFEDLNGEFEEQEIDVIDEDQLYQKAKELFTNFNMSREEFCQWIESSRDESRKLHDAMRNGVEPEDTHNFGTRFMKDMGYQGVLNNIKDDPEYSGDYQGSVVFDIDAGKVEEYINKTKRVFNGVNDFVKYLDTLDMPDVHIPSEDDIKGGKASWRGMPIKYNASLPNEAQNLTDFMEVGPKFFEAQNKDNILDHEVAHNIADRLMKYAAGEWEKATDIFMSNGEGLYGDLGASALSETLAHAVTEYFSDPDALKARSEGAFNYIEEYLKKSGDTLDNVYSKRGESPIESQSDNVISDNEKKIKSYEELKGVLQEYHDAIVNIKNAEGEQKQPHVEKYMDINNLLLEQVEDDGQRSQLMGKLKDVSNAGVDDESIKSIAQMFGIEIPQAVEKTETAMAELNETEQQPDAVVVDNQKKIESYEELKQALQEYYDISSKIKRIEWNEKDEKWLGIESVRFPDGAMDEPEKYFKQQWKRVSLIRKSIKDGADSYIDPELKTAVRIQENTLEKEMQELEAYATQFTLNVEGFSDAQKKFVNEINQKYDKWIQQNEIRYAELDKYNKPYEDRAHEIDSLIGKQLKDPNDMKSYSTFMRALSNVKQYGVTEQSLKIISNLIGVEVPQAAETAKQSIDGLNASLEKQQQIERADTASTQVSEENAETVAIEQQNEALKENISLKQMVDNAEGMHGQSLSRASGATIGNDVGVGANMQELSNILSNITYKVQIVQKHDAPDSDKKAALIDIDALKATLEQITYNTKIVTDDVDKNANKIALDDSSLEATLNRVFANIINPSTQQNDGVLSSIKQAVESINKKIVQGTKVLRTSSNKKTEEKSADLEIKNPKELGNVKATKVDARIKELQGLYEQRGKLMAAQSIDFSQETQEEINQLNKLIQLKFKELNIEDAKRNALKQSLMVRQDDTEQSERSLLIARKADQARKQAAQDEKAELRARIKRNKEEERFNTSTSAWNSGNKALESLWKIDDNVVWDPQSTDGKSKLKPVNQLRDALTELNTVRQRLNDNLRKGIEITGEDSEELRDKTEQVAIHTEAVKKLISNYTALSGANVKETGNVVDQNANLETQLVNAAKALTNSKARIGDFDAATGRLKYTVKTGAYTFQEYEMAVREAGGAIVSVQGDTKRTETFLEGFKRKLGEITRYFSASSLIYKFFNEFRKGIQYVREIDSALTELKKVTDETEETYDNFLDTASKTAAKVGSTIKDVISSTADWARLGYSMKEAAELAESTQILMNVSEFTNISDATDSLISSIQAFKYTAEESMDVVDILNTIGNNYAISTADLAKSLTKSSGSLVAASGTLEEAVALTAAANTIIQDADVVGTALKTVAMRLRGTSVKELEEEGLDTDGAIESVSKLQSKIQALSGVNILTDTGAYKSTYQILSEIANVWEDISDMDQAALLELLAGKRAGSTMAAILQNPDILKDAFEDANDASGSALKENEKYLNSIQGKIDQFNNAVQTLWSNTLNSDVVKQIIDLGTTLVKIIDNLGVIQALFIGIGTYLLTKHDLTGAIGGFFDSKTLNKAAERLDLEDQLRQAKEDIDNLWADGGTGDSDFGPEFDIASQRVDEINDKIKRNGMSIDDANAKMQQFGDTTNETGRKGIKAWDKLQTGAKKFGKQLLNTLKSMAIMYAITTALSLIGDILGGLKDLIIDEIETAEKAQEEFEKLNSELSSVQSEIKSLNSALEDTQDRIDELIERGSLSFTEQEELERLRAENAELERKITLNKTLEESLQKSTNAASIHATDMYLDTSFGSELSKTERQEEASETGGKWGKYGGAALGAAIGSIIPGVGTAIGAIVGAGIGAFIGEPIGEAIGSAVEGAAYDAEQTVKDSLDHMISQREQLKKNQDDALARGDSEGYKNATEALQMYDKQMSKHITQIQENYNSMDWGTATTEEKEKMKAYADWLDKYNISMKATNAKSNAITRLFGEEADEKLKNIKADIEAAMNAAKVNETDPDFDFQSVFNADGMEEFRQRLYDMGLTITDVKYYFLDFAKAEKEAEDSYTTYDTVKQINSLSGGIKSLKDAFGEITEEGYVSTETLVELEETFGGLGDSWENFVDTVATGTGSIKEATEAINELLEAYLTDKLASGPMTAEEQLKTIMLLQQLGVKNAKEYVDAMQKSQMVSEIAAKSAESDDARQKMREMPKRRTKEEEEEYQRLSEIASKTTEDYIKEVEEKYKIDLTPEEESLLIEKAITAEKKKQAVEDAKAAKIKYDEAIRNKEEAKEKYDNAVKKYNDAVSQAKSDFHTKSQNTNTITGEHYLPGYDGLYDWYTEEEYVNEMTRWIRDDVNKEFAAYNAIEIPAEVDVEGAIADSETANNELQDAYDAAGIKIDIVLADPSDLVDQIQDVFDTLVNAQKEYEENGYLSVDTLQSLLQLEPKYLDLLVDEEGNLNLTKDALYKVSIARINDMKLKQQDAILTSAEKLANEGSVDAMNAFVNAAYDSTEAYEVLINNRLASIRAALEERKANGDLAESFDIDAYINGIKNQLDAVDYVAQSTINNIENSLSSSGNTASGEVEDAFQKAMDYWDNRIEANQAKYDQIQNDIDWLESQGKMADANYYKDQIALMTEGEESKTAFLDNKLAQAAARMRELEAAGQEGSDEWWEAAGIYNDTLSELDDVRDTVIDLQDAIGEVEWSQFEEFNTRLDDINSKLETMRDLIAPDGEEDWFDDEGNWTEKGVAVIGSYIQSLEYYKNGLAEANKELEEFQSKEYNEANAKWFANTYGIHSEQEYYDYLQKLTDEQYNYATAVSDTEQDIVGMYESSIDAVEEYTSELIDSYNDYIDVVKEALDAERDLYNFKKDVKKQTKDIANLERRIASLSGSTNASDIAERRKLEAELYESRESLNDTYYEHSMDSQQEALDKEAQAYEESMNKFIEGLRANLDLALQDMDAFMVGVTAAVTANAPLILDEYGKLGISLDSAIVAPWQAAKDKMSDYTKEDGLGLMNSWTASGGVFDTFANNATTYLTSIWDDSNVDPNDAFATAINNKVQGIVTSIKSNVETAKGYLNDLANVADTSVGAPSIGGNGGGDGGGEPTKSSPAITALQKIINQFFGGALKEDGKAGPLTKLAIKVMQGIIGVKKTGEYDKTTYEALKKWLNARPVGSWFREKGITIPAPMYASGTMGTKQSGFAVTDESWIGEEITLAAGKNGQLQYLKKGSAVMPADISANLIEWGKLNPNMLNVGGGANINMISNAINKPEINLDIAEFLHVDKVDRDTMPELEKFVDKKMNDLVRQLNYSIKKFK